MPVDQEALPIIYTINSENFVKILFTGIVLKHIFATSKIRDKGMIYLYQ